MSNGKWFLRLRLSGPEVVATSENIYQSARRNIPEDLNLQIH